MQGVIDEAVFLSHKGWSCRPEVSMASASIGAAAPVNDALHSVIERWVSSTAIGPVGQAAQTCCGGEV